MPMSISGSRNRRQYFLETVAHEIAVDTCEDNVALTQYVVVRFPGGFVAIQSGLARNPTRRGSNDFDLRPLLRSCINCDAADAQWKWWPGTPPQDCLRPPLESCVFSYQLTRLLVRLPLAAWQGAACMRGWRPTFVTTHQNANAAKVAASGGSFYATEPSGATLATAPSLPERPGSYIGLRDIARASTSHALQI